jgi:hypothetical protein
VGNPQEKGEIGLTLYSPHDGREITPTFEPLVAIPEAPKDEIKLPPDIQPAPGHVLLVRIADVSGYWSKETGIVKAQDEWKERTSPYAQIVRVGADKEDFGQRAWFKKGDYVLVNHSLLDPVEMEGETFFLAPFSAIKAKFTEKIND